MLVLSRTPGQSIRIGDNIEVIVTRLSGGRVQIGIDAPREVRVIRTEIDDKEVVRPNQDA